MDTIKSRIDKVGSFTTGFDYLRILLSVAILGWHAMTISAGPALERAIWASPARVAPAVIVPMFFALSGYLVAGSLNRNTLRQFLTLRVIRIVPALGVEIAISALVLGAVFTTLPLGDYYRDPLFRSYFLNIIGDIHYYLPGVFGKNPNPGVMNGQLWTIPYELECYAALAIASIIGFVRHPKLLLVATIVAGVVLTTMSFTLWPIKMDQALPGRVMVLAFLVGVLLQLFRDKVPYHSGLGVGAAVLSVALLLFPNTAYLAAFPVAYLTVWLGLLTPPEIPFGDLSYGVFLFHFPVEQTWAQLCVRFFPAALNWWSTAVVGLAVTGVLAWLSWTLVEHPILKRKRLIIAAVDKTCYPIDELLVRLRFRSAPES